LVKLRRTKNGANFLGHPVNIYEFNQLPATAPTFVFKQ